MAKRQIVIEIWNSDYEDIKEIGFVPVEYAEDIAKSIINGILLPENATNGDVIKAVFPNALISDYIVNDMTIIYLQDENESEMVVPEDWWFAPYKEGEE